MDKLQHTVSADGQLPRWVQIVAGVVITPLALVGVVGSATLVASPPIDAPISGAALGLVFSVGSLWVLSKSVYMVRGATVSRPFLSPLALRVTAIVAFLLPLGGFFTGYYAQLGVVAVVQAVVYVFIGVGLLLLAQERSRSHRAVGT